MPSNLFANLQTMSLFVLPSSLLLSSDHQNIIVTITIVWFCCHHHFIMSLLMDTDVLDLLVQDEDREELLLSSSCLFVFHSGMNCPVISCGFGSFNTRKSYSRHWETKHKPHHIIFHCSIPGCKSTCKRKTDMRYHLRSIHHLNQLSLENQLQLWNHEIQLKNNFIDTGSLKFVSHFPCDKKAQSSLAP